MIYRLTRFYEYLNKIDEFSRKYRKTVNALIEMLCKDEHALYCKELVKTTELFYYLNECIIEDTDGISLRDLICQTVWHYDICSGRYNIKRPTEYLKSLLWDEIRNFNL